MIRTFQKKYTLQNKEAADLFGCSISALQKWRSGSVMFPESIRKLLLLLDQRFDGNRVELINWVNHSETQHRDLDR